MKHNCISLVLLALLLSVTACNKDYFDELRHPLSIEGSFDPMYGIPVAHMSANMNTIVGMVDTNQNLTVRIGSDDIVYFRYDYYDHTVLSWVAEKGVSGRVESKDDLVRYYYVIKGTEKLDLFKKLQEYDTNTFRINEFLVSLTADVRGFVNSSFQEILAEGSNLTFDSLELVINCLDGFRETLPLQIATEAVTVTELLETRHLELLDRYNLRDVAEHKPYSVDYTVRMCITLPPSQLLPGSTFQEQINYIGVDSMMADFNGRLELPLNFYTSGMAYTDTLDVDLSSLGEQLANIEQDTLRSENYTLHLNNDSCYLAFAVGNGLPIALAFDVTFLDANDQPILSSTDDGEYSVGPAPLKPLPGHINTFIAAGATQTLIKTPISLSKLKQMGETRRVVYHILLNTVNPDLSGDSPTVAVLGNDRVDIRSYVVLSPHADFTLPVDMTEIPMPPFNK